MMEGTSALLPYFIYRYLDKCIHVNENHQFRHCGTDLKTERDRFSLYILFLLSVEQLKQNLLKYLNVNVT